MKKLIFLLIGVVFLISCEKEEIKPCYNELIGKWKCYEKNVYDAFIFNPGWHYYFNSDFSGCIIDPDSVKFTKEFFTWDATFDSVTIDVYHNYTEIYKYSICDSFLTLECWHHKLLLKMQ